MYIRKGSILFRIVVTNVNFQKDLKAYKERSRAQQTINLSIPLFKACIFCMCRFRCIEKPMVPLRGLPGVQMTNCYMV